MTMLMDLQASEVDIAAVGTAPDGIIYADPNLLFLLFLLGFCLLYTGLLAVDMALAHVYGERTPGEDIESRPESR